jgi:hypothetical protein
MWEIQPSIEIANMIVQSLNAETSGNVISTKEMDSKK